MKKLFLIAAIGIAGYASANYSNVCENHIETLNEKKTTIQECGVAITFWENGRIVGYQEVSTDQPDLESCQNFQETIIFILQMNGFRVTR